MTTFAVTLGVIGGAALLALVFSIFTLVVHQKIPPLSTLQRQVQDLDLRLSDLSDRYDHMQRRQSVRKARETREANLGAPAVPEEPVAVDIHTHKQNLRRAVARRMRNEPAQ